MLAIIIFVIIVAAFTSFYLSAHQKDVPHKIEHIRGDDDYE